MRSTWFSRTAWAALLVALGAMTVGASVAAAKPRPGRPRAMNLFAASGLFFQVNRQGCGIENTGQVCVAFAGSPVGGGSFWPKGTPDQYIFNSGLQLAGIVDRASGFPWAGDTVGYLFFNASGGEGGEGLDFVYDRLNPADVAAWPNGAVVRDPLIYNPALLGLPAISQGDAWTRYWEGNPSLAAGRDHPMGIAVDMRALAWNYPVGNEDIIYFIFTFYNVTALKSSGIYNNPTIPASIQDEIGAIGDRFQSLNEQAFRISIPDGGYTIDSMYAAFGMDADVANFNANYATAILPFDIGLEYTGDWLPDPGWVFPPDIFGSPFYPAVGFIGVKYLKGPLPGQGITMFSQHFNPNVGFGLLDPNDVRQLYRYLSGFFGPSDTPCSVGSPATARALRLCYLGQVQGDARFYQSSGPFDLAPGEARSIVVAYINAAPVREHVLPFLGGDLPPGVPATAAELVIDANVRTIERIAGWVSATDGSAGRPANSAIEQDEVTTVPRSLLNKALVAQEVFNSKFLLPFAPEAPTFFLIPGDNQVAVVWQPSPSEAGGDPFFVVAGNSSSPLYDQNFRGTPGNPPGDVEGYRIYRGRSSSDLELVAQVDYDGTVFTDYTGTVSYGDTDGDGLDECAPELGVTGDCPAFPNDVDLVGNFIQVPAGQRVQLANGGVLVLAADTAVINVQCGTERCPPLANTGVGFAYTDTDVRNSFTYFYAVTAFDVNSLRSGPTSLESPRVTKRVTPRRAAPNEVQASLVSLMSGDDGVPLNPSASFTLSSTTGRFSGTPPSTNVLEAVFAPVVAQLLPAISLTATIDSLKPRAALDATCPSGAGASGTGNALDVCYLAYVTFDRDGVKTPFTVIYNHPVWSAFGEPDVIAEQLGALAIKPDSASVERMRIPQGFVTIDARLSGTFRETIRFSAMEGQAARRAGTGGIPDLGGGARFSPGGSRWFAGSNETEDHPGYGIRVGHLAGTDTVWAPIHHTDVDPTAAGEQSYGVSGQMQCFTYLMGGLARQADVRFTWGAGGTISEVRDLTHHVPVLFRPTPQASYGFVGDNNGNGVIDWRDFNYLETVSQYASLMTAAGFLGCAHTDPGAPRPQLQQQPVIMTAVTEARPPSIPPDTGTGFGLYINGERYIFFLTGGTPPASGTAWTLRTYAGLISASSGGDGLTPSGYRLRAVQRPPVIPGVRVTFNVPEATKLTAEDATTLANVHTVPDPYYVTSSLEFTANQKFLKFVNLPPQAIIRIYSVSGVLVALVPHNDQTFGGEATWNLRNRNNQFVASGVYFYHVETPTGQTKVGRFTIINFAP